MHRSMRGAAQYYGENHTSLRDYWITGDSKVLPFDTQHFTQNFPFTSSRSVWYSIHRLHEPQPRVVPI